MKRSASVVVAVVIAVIQLFGPDAGAQARLGTWAIAPLGRLPGAIFSEALAINGRGEVVGWSGGFDGNAHAVLWRDGQILDLGTLGGTMSRAWGINDRGQVVGEAQSADGEFHAFLWEDGVMTALSSEPFNRAFAINRRSEVVGHYQLQALLWRDGVLTPLDLGSALDVNDRGEIAGNTPFGSGPQPAIVERDGQVTRLGLPAGATSAAARAINQRRVVVGEAIIDDIVRGFRWEDGRFELVPALVPQSPSSFALDVNDHGLVVGQIMTDPNAIGGAIHGFVWSGSALVDLGTLPGGRESVARAINDRGEVVGFSLNAAGEGEAVAWLPRH